MNDLICLSRKSKKGKGFNERCHHNKIIGTLFCGKHKNSKEKFDGTLIPKIKESYVLQPNREFSIINVELFQNNPNIIYKFNLYTLRKNLKFYNLEYKGKKIELIERLNEYFNLQTDLKKSLNEIKLLQGIIKRKLLFNRYGPAIGIRSLCHNDSDYLFNENINEIALEEFFSYNDNNFTYAFTVNSFKQLINWNCKKNPYNNQEIPQHAINMLENRTNYMKINNITSENYEKPELTEQEEIEQKSIDIFSRIDALGNYTNHKWFTNLNMLSLQKLYTTIEDIWFYRAELTNEIRDKISNKNPVFTIKPEIVKTWNINKKIQLQKLLLSNYDILISSSKEIDDHKHAALLILTGLVDVSTDACYAHPLLAQALWGV
jgi:hypothetical protein